MHRNYGRPSKARRRDFHSYKEDDYEENIDDRVDAFLGENEYYAKDDEVEKRKAKYARLYPTKQARDDMLAKLEEQAKNLRSWADEVELYHEHGFEGVNKPSVTQAPPKPIKRENPRVQTMIENTTVKCVSCEKWFKPDSKKQKHSSKCNSCMKLERTPPKKEMASCGMSIKAQTQSQVRLYHESDLIGHGVVCPAGLVVLKHYFSGFESITHYEVMKGLRVALKRPIVSEDVFWSGEMGIAKSVMVGTTTLKMGNVAEPEITELCGIVINDNTRIGTVMQKYNFEGTQYQLYNCDTAEGDCGLLVYNTKGKVLGVHCIALKDKNVNGFIPLSSYPHFFS
jgi:hypothetical protein